MIGTCRPPPVLEVADPCCGMNWWFGPSCPICTATSRPPLLGQIWGRCAVEIAAWSGRCLPRRGGRYGRAPLSSNRHDRMRHVFSVDGSPGDGLPPARFAVSERMRTDSRRSGGYRSVLLKEEYTMYLDEHVVLVRWRWERQPDGPLPTQPQRLADEQSSSPIRLIRRRRRSIRIRRPLLPAS